MEKLNFKNIFSFKKKSKIKAGDGLPLSEGQYAFYTSSDRLTKSLNEYLFEGESLIFGTGGHASIHYTESRFAVSTDCYVCQPLDSIEVDLKYVYHYLNGNIHLLEEGFKGAGLKHISKSYIEDLEIPLPDLATQQKIAAVLDKADELRQYNKQLIEKYDALTQSLFLDMFGDPVKNEKGWEKRKLETFGTWKSGGTPSRKVEEYYNGDIPWLSSGELNSIFVDRSKEYITETAIKNSSTAIIKQGSLLLGMYDTAALKSSINTVELACNQAIAYCKLENVNTIYIYFTIQYGKEYYKSQQRGVRQKNLNLSIIKNIEINYPPVPLQNKFADRVKLIEQQKELVQQALQKSEGLFNSLLQKAFKGELVAQYEL